MSADPAVTRPAAQTAPPRLELLTTPGCHLCARAREDLAGVAGEYGLEWSARDISQDAQLLRRYGTEVPVLLVDGTPRDFWRLDVPRLRRILAGRLAGRDPEA